MHRCLCLSLFWVLLWVLLTPLMGVPVSPLLAQDSDLSRDDLVRTVRDAACMKCHQGSGVRATEFAAVDPPLILRASDRFRPEWLVRWLTDPAAV